MTVAILEQSPDDAVEIIPARLVESADTVFRAKHEVVRDVSISSHAAVCVAADGDNSGSDAIVVFSGWRALDNHAVVGAIHVDCPGVPLRYTPGYSLENRAAVLLAQFPFLKYGPAEP